MENWLMADVCLATTDHDKSLEVWYGLPINAVDLLQLKAWLRHKQKN